MRRYSSILVLCVAACAAPPTRLPLLVPFSPTNGATPVPGNGIGLGMDIGSSLRGPELARGEIRTASIGVGMGDRFSIWYGSPHSDDYVDGAHAHTGVEQVRAKVLLARPFEGRAALAILGGHAWGQRTAVGFVTYPSYASVPLQDDKVWSWEVAAPAELLLGRRRAEARPSVFLGPRVVYMRYDDRLRQDGTFTTFFSGAVGGLHVSTYNCEFFFESTVAYVPQRVFLGGNVGGHLAVMPALGIVFRIGSPYHWGLLRR